MNRDVAAYVRLFNVQADYFECHERGEALWFERDRPYVLKGLIQAAVCLYHLQRGNVRGSQIMWSRARDYLSRYIDSEAISYEGIHLLRLIAVMDAVQANLPSDWHGRRLPLSELATHPLPEIRVRLANVVRGTLSGAEAMETRKGKSSRT